VLTAVCAHVRWSRRCPWARPCCVPMPPMCVRISPPPPLHTHAHTHTRARTHTHVLTQRSRHPRLVDLGLLGLSVFVRSAGDRRQRDDPAALGCVACVLLFSQRSQLCQEGGFVGGSRTHSHPMHVRQRRWLSVCVGVCARARVCACAQARRRPATRRACRWARRACTPLASSQSATGSGSVSACCCAAR
jgi:hypothetical protein